MQQLWVKYLQTMSILQIMTNLLVYFITNFVTFLQKV